MQKSYLLLLVFFFLKLSAWSQTDTTIFSFQEFISIVKQHHPITYQANLKIQKGEAKLLKAKGGFDPKLQGVISQKYFNGSQYYSYLNSGLKIPTWFGVSFQGGYGVNNGAYLNPELTTPNNGLWYAGVTVNLGQGLFIDKRRAELKQAKIYTNSTQLEQKLILNQLIYDASISYWNWYKVYNKVQVYKVALKNAEFRFKGVRESALIGEKALVDTLKAVIQVQRRQLILEQLELELANKKALLETFLWQDGFIPLEIDSTLKPMYFQNSTLYPPILITENEIDTLVFNHPQMLYYQYNIDMLKIENRLKKENLKPTLQVKYNALSTPLNQNVFGDYSLNNYNWGAKVAYPVFTRKERGDLRISEIKIKEKESQFINKRAEIKYKLIANYNSWNSSIEQVEIYQKAVLNYYNLFMAELTMFNIGESSLFLVNYREQEYVKAQIQLIELIFNNYISKANWLYQTVDFK
ncbi:MAG TPA: TolC family protein [Crocinitomix sp.]|nr:TolC family protein [Crocinitomix sp.]